MKNVIAIANHKGGVGKTTTATSVGGILALQGNRVLMIDLDAQANLTTSLIDETTVEESVYDAMIADDGNLPIVHVSGNLDLSPASLQLAMLDVQLATVMARELILANLVKKVEDNYDYIIIDCPPALGMTTMNAFAAADNIVIPMTAEFFSFKGLQMIKDFVTLVRKRLNKQARITGILLTRFESSNLSREIEQGLRNNAGDLLFKTRIRKNIALGEAQVSKTNIVSYAPKSNGAVDYLQFVAELTERMNA